jgi:ABC-type amino acid transport substrate-binding protein
MGNDYPSVKSEKYDAIIGSITATPERDKQVDFMNQYYLSGAQIFVAEGNNAIQSKDDLKLRSLESIIDVHDVEITINHFYNLFIMEFMKMMAL